MQNEQPNLKLPYQMKAQKHSWNLNDLSKDSSKLSNQRRKQSMESNSWGVPNSWRVQDSWGDPDGWEVSDSQGVEHDERMKREEASRFLFSQNIPNLLGMVDILLTI